MKIKYFPPDIITKYNLLSLLHSDGYIYIKIIKGLYGLKQEALNAYNYLSKLLTNGGYEPIPNTLGMWKHSTRPTIFNLCVDDFGIKYYNQEDLQHLKSTVEQRYIAKMDYEGQHFLGLTLDWNYQQGYVDISMPGYIEKFLNV